jgi:metallo-beta-lactamase family protein
MERRPISAPLCCPTPLVGLEHDERRKIVPGVAITLRNAGHILGAAIIELGLGENGRQFRLVFSGDLGYDAAPLMHAPMQIDLADLVIMESTYGNRNHRPFAATLEELRSICSSAAESGGSILIPLCSVCPYSAIRPSSP